MFRSIPVLAVLATIMIVVGCRVDFTEEINASESLLSVLTKVEKSSEEIDPRLIKQYVNNVSEKCLTVERELTDTLELEQAQMLVRFCSLKEHFQSCLDRKELIDAELLKTRNQLFNLKSDLKENRAIKDSVNLYIEQEFLFVESLGEGVDQVVVELNSCFETYTELKDEIDRLLIALPNKD